MNKIWLYLVLLSSLTLIFTSPESLIPTMMETGVNIVTLSLEFCAIYSVWLGLLEIVDASGLSDKLAKLLSPIVKKLFKTDNKNAIKQISISLSANILGLGNAATPSAIKAMEILDDKSGKLNYPMMIFIVLSCCSIQLLPTTIISLRVNAGSQSGYDIIIPILLTSLVTTTITVSIAVLYGKLRNKIHFKFSFKKLFKRQEK